MEGKRVAWGGIWVQRTTHSSTGTKREPSFGNPENALLASLRKFYDIRARIKYIAVPACSLHPTADLISLALCARGDTDSYRSPCNDLEIGTEQSIAVLKILETVNIIFVLLNVQSNEV